MFETYFKDHIDIVSDAINPNEYNAEEDPGLFTSQKTDRGPLGSNWLEELKANASHSTATSTVGNKSMKYMCAYKLCRIECAFWGCQSRVEKLISESVLRHMILMSHRQAWCWQDECFDLTIDDVRELELETQRYLNMKMRNEQIDPETFNSMNKSKLKIEDKSSSTQLQVQKGSDNNKLKVNEIVEKNKKICEQEKTDYEDFSSSQDDLKSKYNENGNYNENLRPMTTSATITPMNQCIDENNEFEDIYNEDSDFGDNEEDENDDEKDNLSQNSNFDEFYDAISQASFNLSTNTNESETKSTNSISLSTQLTQKLNKQKFLSRLKKEIILKKSLTQTITI